MFWLQVIMAGLMIYLVFRLWPVVREHYKNGPKGSSSQWLNFALLMGGIALFVLFLVSMVRKL